MNVRENLNFTIEKFLEGRELRVEKQNELMDRYSLPLLVVRANYPGTMKNEYPAPEIVEKITEDLLETIGERAVFKEMETTLEGRIFTGVFNMDSTELKKKMIYLEENHPLGRFVDIDVYGDGFHSISRTDLGYPRRKCYICQETAVICTRSQAHTLEDLKHHILKGYEKYLLLEHKREQVAQKLGEIALKSCILELSCHPSFGLVSPITQGSHRDMDYFTFLESSFAIKRGLSEMAFMGYSYMDIHDIFKVSRKIGIRCEREMFEATGDINTHKGMIFLLGIAIQSVAKILYLRDKTSQKTANISKHIIKNEIERDDVQWKRVDEKKNPENRLENSSYEDSLFYKEIQKNITAICQELTKDFDLIPEKIENGEKLTNGEKLYLKHGFLGIRGEVKEGLKVVFEESLPYFETLLEGGERLNTAMVKTLLKLMGRVEDSTIVNRKGIEILREVQLDAQNLLKDFSLEKCEELEKKYIEKNISPGGSADLLAITLFFYNAGKICSENSQKRISQISCN